MAKKGKIMSQHGNGHSEGLRIVQLTVENVKRVQAVTITPNGNTVIIGGDNKQGKSSTLDSIAYALGGGKLIPEKPIRNGAKHARIEVDLGEFVVERKFTKTGSTLTVTPKDGPKFPSPQAVLDKLIGKLSFDPLAFLDMEPKKQLLTLKELVGINFDDLDKKREQLYEERSLINRDIKNLDGQIEGIPEHADIPDAPVLVDTLLVQIEEAEQHNAKATQLAVAKTDAEREVERCQNEIANREKAIEELRQRAISMKEEQAQLTATMSDYAARAASLSGEIGAFESKDTSSLKEAIKNAEETNRKIRDKEAHKTLTKQLRAKNADAMKLTLAIEGIDGEKEARLAEAKFPVQGLSFGEDGVLLNSLPLEQASSREQIETSVGISFATSGGLKIALVRNASLIDEKGLALIAKIAEEQNGQLWLERVSHGSECSVIIEDGMVSEVREPVELVA